MLEVDNRVILPESTDLRFIIKAADVINSSSACTSSLGDELGKLPHDYSNHFDSLKYKITEQPQLRCTTQTRFSVYSQQIPVRMQWTSPEQVVLHQKLISLPETKYTLMQNRHHSFRMYHESSLSMGPIQAIPRLISDLNAA
uniref:Cytochrome oxidase subunit II copper A binding domain-containing protein n=3 Tax=Rhynchosporium TaxID=38037 RepID=V5W685_RHYSE|nr:hypothetical protein [Rhynchosporium agropyri]YP_008965374.1 hypothetical protein [Rhynchosporium commune]YP_008965448.1 hypothetical protein [Rhynchosporium secalis]AHC02326.1 hypothetical protein [Rhynchosporium agropyri]AHC02372.1 hypothetical protein [Rhynchosporium commune]AHC02446.1 hypothetical protein [Rhynchosporium secalis]